MDPFCVDHHQIHPLDRDAKEKFRGTNKNWVSCEKSLEIA